MKNIILLFAFLCSVSLFGQIKILKNDALQEVGKENSVALYKKDKKYTFNYQDVSNSNLNTFRSFYFFDLNKDLDQLFKLITDGFIDMPTSEITMELPNDIIGLKYARNYGQVTVQFLHYINKNMKTVGKSQFLTKKQIEKIFGKDKIAETKAPSQGSFTGFAENNKPNTSSTAAGSTNTPAPTKAPAKKAVPKKK